MDYTEFVESIAEQYRADGYAVILQPKPDDLPDFLQRHEIDMLAHRNDEHVVIEVKSKADLNTEGRLAYLAGEVNSHSGWRFDLVVANGSPWPDDVAGDSTEPDAGRIRSLADAATRLLSQGELEASCLMAWSAAEAAMRDAAARASISLNRKMPQYVLNALATEGIVSSDEYSSISAALRVRNSIAHGLSSGELSSELTQTLIRTARELLDRQMTTIDA